MYTWHWRTWEGLPYLSCSLLEPFAHGFFTQQFSPLSPCELTKVLQPQALEFRLKQVHGNIVLTPSEIKTKLIAGGSEVEGEGNSALVLGDGLLSEHPLEALWVASADCTPVLIADEKTGRVAAVHAGWRGTAAKILPVALARFQTLGSQLGDLRIAMGPAIAGAVYQVSVDVAAKVGASIIPHKNEDEIVSTLQQILNPPVKSDPNPGKVRLDVRRINVLQIEQLGISPEQIAVAPFCTYQTPQHFFSYRRDNLKKVQWSGIVSQ